MNDTSQYEALHSQYRWLVPSRFNIAHVCCRRWATSATDARRIAVFVEHDTGSRDIWTFERVFHTANQLSNGLRRMGVGPGDRVAVMLPQGGEAAAAHMAIYQMGAVCVPLSPQLGPEALEFRLCDSQARLIILDVGGQASVLSVLHRCPTIEQLIGIGFADERTVAWRSLLARQENAFPPHDTASTDPALLLYTGGTTGAPKGVLHAHAALIGTLPAFVSMQDWFPQPGDSLWTPAEWSWIAGLLGGLLPALYFGRPVVAAQGRVGAARAFELLARYQVTNALLTPVMLRAMRRIGAPAASTLRALATTGEPLDADLLAWCQQALGVTPNETYGQSETGFVIGNSRAKWPVRPGSMGLPYPGHRLAVLDEAGAVAPPGAIGEIALARADAHGDPDPALLLGYWRNEPATETRASGEWWRTGDLGRVDDDGYFWYEGRTDDIFRANGFRIGPGNIESWLLNHPAVASAAIVPKPDDESGAIVKAYVVLAESYAGHARSYLLEELQTHARERLAPYESPREFEFVDTLPTTLAGGVQRSVLRERERNRALRRTTPR